MKALEWIKFLETQKTLHGKVLFRVAELSNVSGRAPHALNVEVARLVTKGILARYAAGVYGLPGAVTPEQLVATIDADAYITGMFAMYRHNLVTQAPTVITCFTNRRHNRSRLRSTPLGRLEFVCVNDHVYARPSNGRIAPPEQALCDLAHMAKRRGLNQANLVTFRGLHRLNRKKLAGIARRYSASVGAFLKGLAPPESDLEPGKKN